MPNLDTIIAAEIGVLVGMAVKPTINYVVPRITRAIQATRARAKNILMLPNNAAGLKILEENGCGSYRDPQLDLFDGKLPKLTEPVSEERKALLAALEKRPFVQRAFDFSTPEEDTPEEQDLSELPSLTSLIRKQPGEDVAVVLASSFRGEGVYLGGENVLDFHYLFVLQKALMRHFRVQRLRIFVLLNAETRNLRDAIANPDIDHIVVHGHGSWSHWEGSSGHSFINGSIEPGKEPPLHKSFIRHTCGNPHSFDDFEDQLGTPFAKAVFGTAYITDNMDSTLDPLQTTSKQEFLDQRAQSHRFLLDTQGRTFYRKNRHKQLKKRNRQLRFNLILDSLHLPKAWRLKV